MDNSALKKKLDGPRLARPPVADIARLANLFARLLEDRLRRVLGRRPRIEVVSAEAQMRRDAQGEAGAGDYLAAATLSGAFMAGAIITPTFASRLIEMVTGVDAPQPVDETTGEDDGARALTAIDKALLREPALAIFMAFLDAMPIAPPDVLLRVFQNPSLSPIPDLTDDDGAANGLSIILSATLSHEGDTLRLPVFIPLTTLDLLDDPAPTASVGHTPEPSVWSRAMLRAARDAPFRMVGVLHEKQMSIGDIRDMKVGAVIPLPADHRMQIDLRIDTPQGVSNEPTVGGGVLGAVDGQRAVRLTSAADADFLAHLEILQS